MNMDTTYSVMDQAGGDGGDMHNGHMSDSSDSNDHMDMMMMYFHLGTKETILFKGWKTHNWQTMLGSCIAVFIMATLYEGLKVGREMLLKWFALKDAAAQHESTQPIAVPVSENEPSEPTLTQLQPSVRTRMCSLSHVIQSLLHIIQFVVSYFLMLIFMTYNFYLCLAVALGAGFGFFLFGWKRTSVTDQNEHCH